jgi:hypothetical protein
MIEPGRFSHTEKNRSSVPRSFFYPNTPIHALHDTPSIRGGALYRIQFPASQIFDITKSGDRWKNKYGYHDQDQMFNDIKEEYPAAYYRTRGFPVVLLFHAIEATLVGEEEKQALMSQKAA